MHPKYNLNAFWSQVGSENDQLSEVADHVDRRYLRAKTPLATLGNTQTQQQPVWGGMRYWLGRSQAITSYTVHTKPPKVNLSRETSDPPYTTASL